MLWSAARLVAAIPLLAVAPDVSSMTDEPTTSGRLQEICSARSSTDGLACAAYLRGIVEGLDLGQQVTAEDDDGFCLPDDGLSPDQVRAIFLSLVHQEPERRGEQAAQLLLDALDNLFPCDAGDGALPSNPDEPPPPPIPA